jgi:hypothetical protein
MPSLNLPEASGAQGNTIAIIRFSPIFPAFSGLPRRSRIPQV